MITFKFSPSWQKNFLNSEDSRFSIFSGCWFICIFCDFSQKKFWNISRTHAATRRQKVAAHFHLISIIFSQFLGDAVIDYLVTCHLTTLDKTLTPGQVTDLRSALVNNNTLVINLSLVVRAQCFCNLSYDLYDYPTRNFLVIYFHIWMT